MAKANEILKKHLSLVAELQKVAKPNNNPDPIGTTQKNAAAQKSRIEGRIASLEQQRAVFNKQIDESIEREKSQLKEMDKLQDSVAQQQKPEPKPKPKPKQETKPRMAPKPTVDVKPQTEEKPKPRPRKTTRVDATLKATPVRRRATATQTTKRKTPKK
ncbi:hypothetical protein L4D06_11000 [Enterovibrio makurazakiensis]|uniref:hypothetical protein n=1 Tax=Enterovibrio makurazakiensis TaxID=2910232 RepID=UPI003D1BAD9D